MFKYYHTQKYRALKRKREDTSSSSSSNSTSESDSTYENHTVCHDGHHINLINSQNSGNELLVKHDNDHMDYMVEDVENNSFNQAEPVASSSIIEQCYDFNHDNMLNDCDLNDSKTDGTLSTRLEVSSTSNWTTESTNAEENRPHQKTLVEKLRKLCLENISILSNKFITELLLMLKSENLNVPTTAVTLLGTGRLDYERSTPMESSNGSPGSYIYYGITSGLNRRTCPQTFKESKITILVNCDGLPIFKKSKQTFWPILGQVYHPKFYCKPFIIALWHGISKPESIEEYLEDFVQETCELTENEVEVGGKLYKFQLKAIVADTPARAFLECTKGHTGFYACERCETAGLSVEVVKKRRKLKKTQGTVSNDKPHVPTKRIYHEIDARRRMTSPLLRIPDFNIIEGVVLDSMHLNCEGAMKKLIEKWVDSRHPCRLSAQKKSELTELLKSLFSCVPLEFQRKKFDLSDLGNWKATQYRFILLYCGNLITNYILPKDQDRHYSLFFTACRILCHEELAKIKEYVDLAERFLRTFFSLLPTYYGSDCQVMNLDNLIHLPDDIRYMNSSVEHFSCFPFENCLSHIKKLVRTPVNPLTQVARRISELETGSDCVMKRHVLFSVDSRASKSNFDKKEGALNYCRITYKGFKLTTEKPNNVVSLKSGKICLIDRIYLEDENVGPTLKNLYCAVHTFQKIKSASTFLDMRPMGAMIVSDLHEHQENFTISNVHAKCVLFFVNKINYVLTM